MTLNDILEIDEAILYHDETGLMITINRKHYKTYFREEVIQNGNKEFDYEFILGYRAEDYLGAVTDLSILSALKEGAKKLAEDIHSNKADL